jgi:hypothetical protein
VYIVAAAGAGGVVVFVSLTSEFLSQLLLQIRRGCASQERTLAQITDG